MISIQKRFDIVTGHCGVPGWVCPVVNQSKPSHRDLIPAQNGAHANTGLAFFYVRFQTIPVEGSGRLLYSHPAANPHFCLPDDSPSPPSPPSLSPSYLLTSAPLCCDPSHSSNTASVPSHLQATLPSLSPCVALLKSDPFGGTYFETALQHSSSSSQPAANPLSLRSATKFY